MPIQMLGTDTFSSSDRHQLVQQIQMIGGGALGQPAANAVRHVAAENGVWSLGNFGGVPPKSAMMYHPPGMNQMQEDGGSDAAMQQQQQVTRDGSVLPNKIEEPDYRYVFNSCTVGMVSNHPPRIGDNYNLTNICLSGDCFDGRCIHRLQQTFLSVIELHETRSMLYDNI